ncbi:hypothetical protein D3C85_732010 [compost metagenome]
MSINVAKTALENLYDLISTANGKPASSALFTIGAPTVRVPDANLRNTSVLCTSVPGGGFDGEQTFRYIRLDLDDLAPELELQLLEGDTLADVQAWAVTQLGVIAEEVEFEITELPVFDGDEELVELRAKADSYTYIGTKLITLIKPVPPLPTLAESFPVTDLLGFDVA